MKIQSIFGAYAQNMQAVIDAKLDRFAPVFYKKYFDFAPSQVALTFTSVIGASRIEAAASVVNRSSSSPLRSRGQLEKYQGDIPAIKEKFVMREEDYRDFLTLQAMNIDDSSKKSQLLDMLFNDVKKAGTSAHKRLDIMVLEAISTGKISLDIENNPDGLVLTSPMDLLMPTGNKHSVSIKWEQSATATPIKDIEKVVQDAYDKGFSFEKILMSRNVWQQFRKCKEVIDSLVSFKVLQKGAGVATLANVNEYLQEEKLPFIEIIDEVVGVEKDGKIKPLRPFSQTNVSFIPFGKLGVIKNALAMEQMQPVKSVDYAVFDKALISKWQENDPWAEFTQVELNAFPSFSAIDNTFILENVVTQ